ncbi:phospholipase C [Acidocella sp.]|uniref:phospholipase C n=1 Tax=Acidocella sp. TaxID=50710 RepID=UPI00262555C2|nr:alkaline phosphatase family protein [Acidocella sp.]
MRRRHTLLAALALGLLTAQAPPPAGAQAPASLAQARGAAERLPTATPIKHLVIIYDENVSFDHYFATYPRAANPPGEPSFTARPGTPEVDNLVTASLLTNNPNFTNPANGADAANPFRLDRAQAATADQTHNYTPEQRAYDGGKADLFPKYTGTASPGGAGAFGTKGQVMGYYDGNTVTALWNYAQHFAMDDHAYTDTYGPSTPGALEAVAGNTDGMVIVASAKSSYYVKNQADGTTDYTMINDVDPGYDLCSKKTDQVMMRGRNIGDLLNEARITWGGFMGGFDLGVTNPNGTTGCQRSTRSAVVGAVVADYIPHHNWFQYYASTANPRHLRPAALANIGYSAGPDGKPDPANHQYGLEDFYKAAAAGNLPAVSYVKLPAYQDAHAGYSDPLDEQAGLVRLLNFLQRLPEWKDTAVIIAWDDSDGWYDHAFTPVTSASFDPQADQLDGPGQCGTGPAAPGLEGRPVNGRCGPGTRLPFLIVSPWARENYVDHSLITQAAIVRFIEDNWLHGARLGGGSFDTRDGSLLGMFDFRAPPRLRPVLLNPETGEAAAPP